MEKNKSQTDEHPIILTDDKPQMNEDPSQKMMNIREVLKDKISNTEQPEHKVPPKIKDTNSNPYSTYMKYASLAGKREEKDNEITNHGDSKSQDKSNMSTKRCLFSPQLLKMKPSNRKENDISNLSIATKDKSIIMGKNSKALSNLFNNFQSTGDRLDDKKDQEAFYAEYLKIKESSILFKQVKMFGKTIDMVSKIIKQIKLNKDPYDTIRNYSDIAQDNEFSHLDDLLESKPCRAIFTRLLKLERWIVVYMFYFTVQDTDAEKAKKQLQELSQSLALNLSYLLSWMTRISAQNSLNWDAWLRSTQASETILAMENELFFESIHENVKLTLSKLNVLSKDIGKKCLAIFTKFIENMDKWTLNKCFEEAFECFYDTFIQKGVISVSYEDKDNKVSPASTSDTPKKANGLMKLAEEMPTERKSFGEKLIIQELKDNATFEQALGGIAQTEKIDCPFFLFQPDTQKVKQKKKALLPDITQNRQYTLVLDLDETLIHFEENPDGTSQFLIRPHAQQFLKDVSEFYEVVIFTAALKDYADFILDRLDLQGLISHRLYRNNCSLSENVYQKDLTKLGRDLSKTLIVDNNAENFQLQPDNGVYIRSWYNDPNDEALKKLAPLLIGKPYLIKKS